MLQLKYLCMRYFYTSWCGKQKGEIRGKEKERRKEKREFWPSADSFGWCILYLPSSLLTTVLKSTVTFIRSLFSWSTKHVFIESLSITLTKGFSGCWWHHANLACCTVPVGLVCAGCSLAGTELHWLLPVVSSLGPPFPKCACRYWSPVTKKNRGRENFLKRLKLPFLCQC